MLSPLFYIMYLYIFIFIQICIPTHQYSRCILMPKYSAMFSNFAIQIIIATRCCAQIWQHIHVQWHYILHGMYENFALWMVRVAHSMASGNKYCHSVSEGAVQGCPLGPFSYSTLKLYFPKKSLHVALLWPQRLPFRFGGNGVMAFKDGSCRSVGKLLNVNRVRSWGS